MEKASDREHEVATILLEFSENAVDFKSLPPKFNLRTWEGRRKRSSTLPPLPPPSSSVPESSTARAGTPLIFYQSESDQNSKHSQPSVSLKRKTEMINDSYEYEEYSKQEKKKKKHRLQAKSLPPLLLPKPKALSPCTPLSYCPSESERNLPLKRKKDYLEMINDLIESQDFYKREIKKKQSIYEDLKSSNSILKTQMLSVEGTSQQPSMNNHQRACTGYTDRVLFSFGASTSQQPLMILHQRACNEYTDIVGANPSQQPSMNNDQKDTVAPLGIPDLNVPAEAEDSRDKAFAARQKRIEIRKKSKNICFRRSCPPPIHHVHVVR